MILIKGNNGSEPVCLLQNCLMAPQSSEVMGVVLGNCVYGKRGKLKGKLINNSFYNTRGEKVAVENKTSSFPSSINYGKLREGRWAILESIHDHNSPWVQPQEKWANADLVEFLLT